MDEAREGLVPVTESKGDWRSFASRSKLPLAASHLQRPTTFTGYLDHLLSLVMKVCHLWPSYGNCFFFPPPIVHRHEMNGRL